MKYWKAYILSACLLVMCIGQYSIADQTIVYGKRVEDLSTNFTQNNIPYVGTNGKLTSSSDFTYNATTGNIDLGLTAGSIPFANSSGLTEDNANFNWDDANNTLDIGMSTGSIPFANAGGNLNEDNTNFTWDSTNNVLDLNLTAGSVPFANSSGLTEDNSFFSYSDISNTLSVTNIVLSAGTTPTPGVAIGLTNKGFNAPSADVIGLSISGTERFRWSSSSFYSNTSGHFQCLREVATATNPVFVITDDADTGMGSAGADQLSLISGAKEVMRLQTAANAVNYFDITPSATTDPLIIAAAGTDTNIDINIEAKGSGIVNVTSALQVIGKSIYNATLDDATGNETAFLLDYIVNKASSGSDTGLQINMTDTASPGVSHLLQIAVNGSPKLTLQSGGAFTLTGPIYTDEINAISLQPSGNNSTLDLQFRSFTAADNAIEMAGGTASNTSGEFIATLVKPTINQASGTGSYTALAVDVTETAVGSGGGSLLDLRVGGTSKFVVTNAALVGINNGTPAVALDVYGYANYSQPHAELFEDGSSDITITTAETYYQWVTATVGNNTGFAYANAASATDDITIGSLGAGKYFASWGMSLESDPGLCNHGAIFVNGTIADNLKSRETTSDYPHIPSIANSIVVGDEEAGTYADTFITDSVYHNIGENNTTPAMDVRYTFNDPDEAADVIIFSGRYDGQTTHLMELNILNTVDSGWVNGLATTKDYPHSSDIDYEKRIKIPGTLANYYDGSSNLIIRFIHTNSGNTNDNLLVDRVVLANDKAVTSIGRSGFLTLADGDTVDLRITCNVAGAVFTVKHANLSIFRVSR